MIKLNLLSSGQLTKLEFNDIKICEAQVSSSEQVHNHGVILYKEMNLKAPINNICQSASVSAKMATHIFVTSTHDYNKSQFYGLLNIKLSKLLIDST